MTFGEPWWLWELAGVGVFVLILLLFAFGGRKGVRGAVRWPRIARVVATTHGVRPVNAGRTVRRPWLLLLALTGVIFSLAHPRWGTIEEPIVERSREVMIALDLSRSMLVADVPPSRLERARLLVRNLLDGLRGERVGLIVFAGTAFVQVPLSADYQILQEFLPELKPDYMPQGGTDYAGMLRSALEGYGTESQSDRFLIVLSDGESHSDAWREVLPQLRERGVRALTLGLGTPGGGFIPAADGSYLKDERGAVVLSRLEPATLQALARETRGEFRNASAWVDLAELLETTVARGQQGQFAERRNVRHLERFQWFLAPTVALALLGLWREIGVRPRQQTVRRATAGAPARGIAQAASAIAAALLALCPGPSAAEAAAAADASAPDARIRETITRLAATTAPTARDWRELADRTLVYGTGARMNQQPVAPGIVHDALAAVDLGQRAEPRLTDWDRLRTELEALLDTPPDPPPEEKPEEKPPEDKPEDSPSGDSSDPKDPADPDQKESPSPSDQGEPSPDQAGQPPSPPSPSDQPPSTPKPGEGEMGEMKPPSGEEPPPPPTADPADPAAPPPKTRKIGSKPPTEAPPPVDAQTALLLQRMREAAEKDSPARLHQLLEGDDKQPAARGRDW